MSPKLTDSQRAALQDLAERNGEGAIDKRGVVVSAGERLAYDAVTWLRLFTLALVEGAGPLRLRITDAGRRVSTEKIK